jgi:lysophospholipase
MDFVITVEDPVPEGGVVEWLTALDRTRFRVARFIARNPSRGTVVLLNGRTEFIEKYFEVIGDLHERGYAVATLDWRGQGMSDRPLPNRHKGHVDNFESYVSDLRQFVTQFVEPGCPAPYRLLCHSMGGNIGMRYLGRYSETFESAVFSAPMWGIGKHARTPSLLRLVGGAANLLRLGSAYVPGGKDYGDSDRNFEDNVLTHDPTRFARFAAQVKAQPQLELGAPTFEWARQGIASMDIIHAPGFAETVQTPIRICSASADALVSLEAQKLLAARLPDAKQVVIEGAKHELLMESDTYRDQTFAEFDSL